MRLICRDRNSISRLFAVLLALLLGTGRSAAATAPESTDPISISVSDWTGSLLSSGITVKLLQKMGYNAQAVPIDTIAVFPALETGDVAFDMEAWQSSSGQGIAGALKTGKVVSLGSTGLVGHDHWWYPDYVKDKCPGLPDWHALKTCAGLFATPETAPKGQLLLYPSDWGTDDDARVAALGLDLQPVHAGSEAAVLAQVKAAYGRQRPILVWLYQPHWSTMVFKGEFVTLPPYTDECYTSGRYDCEKPEGAIVKLAWAGARQKWPRAFHMAEAFSLNDEEYGAMTREIDVDHKRADAVVDEWLAANGARWQTWIAP